MTVSTPGNFLKSANHVKFTEVCVLRTEKHDFVKKCLQME